MVAGGHGTAASPGLRPEGACTPERGARRLHKGSRPPSGIPIGCGPTPPLNRGSRDASTPGYHLSSLRDEFLGGIARQKYGAFSVSASQLDKIIQYIKDQEAHHRKMTFQVAWTQR